MNDQISSEIAASIQQEQRHGRQKYGGSPDNTAHDDCHTDDEWAAYISDHNERARVATPMERRQHLIKVAGLAVSAIESIDRRRRTMIGPIVDIKRDEKGFWDHPHIPWSELPEDQSSDPFFRALGLEPQYCGLQYEDSDASERYWEGDEDCSVWEPKKPEGEGWFLASIYDTEDGPYACWVRLSPATEVSS